jgi:leucyl aminopeptidase
MTRKLPFSFSYSKIKSLSLSAAKNHETLVLGVGSEGEEAVVPKSVKANKELEKTYSILTKLLHFSGKHESSVTLLHHSKGLESIGAYQHLVGVGIGSTHDCYPQALLSLGGKIAQDVKHVKSATAHVYLDSFYLPASSVSGSDAPKDFAGRPLLESLPTREAVLENIALGMLLGAYTFDRYKKKKSDAKKKTEDKAVEIHFSSSYLDPKKVEKIFERVFILAESVYLTRDLQTTPGGDLPPAEIARAMQQSGREAGFDVQVWDEKKLKQEGMNGILAVGQGSAHPPRFIISEYNKGKKNLPTVVFVGKGVSFDTGGISIKPAPGMEDMKYDMSGAAAVVGAMHALAKLKAPVHAVGLIPSAENMVSGNATRPGDIYTAYDGQTVKVLNTDAEGRLILADALSYAAQYKPDCVIDIATLTGAVVIGLGHLCSGVMGNNAQLIDGFRKASAQSGERVWELPLYKEYEDEMRGKISDIRNIGSDRSAGSQKGGTFLNMFVKNQYPWIHVDIAGTSDHARAQGSHCPANVGTAVPTRSLVEFAENVQNYFKVRKA